MPPRVSVLLPVRDCERFISAALASVRRQTFSDLELICVDDGSRDATPEILARHGRADPRVRVVNTEARGIAAALNTALEHARGSLIGRMDADDICHRHRFEWQVQALDREPAIASP